MTFEEWWYDSGLAPDSTAMEKDAARCAWNAATKAEREACAKLCDIVAGALERAAQTDEHKRTAMHMCTWIAGEIRTMGNPDSVPNPPLTANTSSTP